MHSYIVGDDLGAIKRVTYTRKDNSTWQPDTTSLSRGSSKLHAIQKLTIFKQDSETLLAVARANGEASVSSFTDERIELVAEWKETRLKDGQEFVGLAAGSRGIYSCTSNGALRLTKPGDDGNFASELASLPMRLSEWRLSSNEEVFAYAGDEVELSVWNSETAFSTNPGEIPTSDASAKKRKRGDQLLPGEIWRAKNLPNDSLNLRQPVRNSALAFLQPSSTSSQHHILVGTQLGDVRRYDTRAARRPVANWVGIAKAGGVGVVEKGCSENEAFVSDKGCNLFALDLRNGKVSFSYKGLSGAISSVAPSPSFLATASQDRFLRLHSTFPPPKQPADQQENKGQVLDKLYMKVAPTVVVLEQAEEPLETTHASLEGDGDQDDDVWDKMEDAEVESDGEHRISRKRKI
ncbi:hypothetical protein NLI96_g4784 [Meripilus lineatus]|uniref:Ribosome biogenesis protein NSA1 n=1 Tax=Meripilus lineatus TaxID=2056292 RepID=A0AAD5V4B9_9APHY|nr:hypothetical protein NLI96_g4784 [Physisporinus lineatus]